MQKDVYTGYACARLSQIATNITPFAQSYYHWWRMPKMEFDAYYRFIPFYVTGQLDTTKEVLIPRKKNGEDGYDVISPLYCYDGGRFSVANHMKGKQNVIIDKSALIINRGWIPATQKDRLTRPKDIHTNKLVKIPGIWRKGKNLHDYKYPNDPSSNEWHNIQLEDIGLYFDIPNFDEMKHYYF
jgi:cytochrome oxidase assembly protein ShyY1